MNTFLLILSLVIPAALLLVTIVYIQAIGSIVGCIPNGPYCKVNSQLWGPRLAIVALGIALASYVILKRAFLANNSPLSEIGQYYEALFFCALLVIVYILFSFYLVSIIKTKLDSGSLANDRSITNTRKWVNSLAAGCFVLIEFFALKVVLYVS